MRDSEYIKKRDNLIPVAAKIANQKIGKHPQFEARDDWVWKWNRCFLETMDNLAIKTGLIKKGGE